MKKRLKSPAYKEDTLKRLRGVSKTGKEKCVVEITRETKEKLGHLMTIFKVNNFDAVIKLLWESYIKLSVLEGDIINLVDVQKRLAEVIKDVHEVLAYRMK